MARAVSNGHVTNDVTWPIEVKIVTYLYLDANILNMDRNRSLEPITH